MAAIDLISFNIFVFISTFTPGPGNIASAGMGMTYGYRRTTQFILGIVTGYLFVMTLSAFLSSTLMRIIPRVEPLLRILGSAYILCLAYKTAKSSSVFSTKVQFSDGPLAGLLSRAVVVINPEGKVSYTQQVSEIADEPDYSSALAALK